MITGMCPLSFQRRQYYKSSDLRSFVVFFSTPSLENIYRSLFTIETFIQIDTLSPPGLCPLILGGMYVRRLGIWCSYHRVLYLMLFWNQPESMSRKFGKASSWQAESSQLVCQKCSVDYQRGKRFQAM